MRAVELFCGAGGMSKGMLEAGINVIQAYDVWPVAIETYRRNVGQHAQTADLKDLLGIIPEICRLQPQMIFGGPPCQDYSAAGRRTENENARLTTAFAITVATVRPEWFVIENVVQLQTSEVWAQARELLKRAGYGISESKINTAFFGVPQARKRLFVIGRLGERDGFLQSAVANAASTEPMTLRQLFDRPEIRTRSIKPQALHAAVGRTIADLCSEQNQTDYTHHAEDLALIENGYVYCRPLRAGRGVRSIDEPTNTITRTSWEKLTDRYLKSPHDDDPVPACKAAMLTRRQISMIQGFPADWEWISGTRQDVYQMIANAVPAPVATKLAQVILARHSGETIPEVEGRFVDWLVSGKRARSTARNIKANLNRARQFLGGRTFTVLALETEALEGALGFQNLPKATRSDLRQALRLYSEFLALKGVRIKSGQKLNTDATFNASYETLDAA